MKLYTNTEKIGPDNRLMKKEKNQTICSIKCQLMSKVSTNTNKI